MSKIKFIALLWSIVLLASCSDEPTTSFITPPTESEALIEIDGIGAFGSLNLKADGAWSATIVEDDADWIYLETKEGKGASRIDFTVDRNSDESARKATIRVSNETQSVEYIVVQTERPSNAASDADYYDQLIGRGMAKIAATQQTDLRDFTISTNIVNYAGLKDAAVADLDPLVTVSNNPTRTFTFTDLVEYQNSDREITADLSVDISYGLFKLGLSGHFQMYGEQRDTIHCFGGVANVPSQILELDYVSLNTYAQEEEYKDLRKYIFTSAFRTRMEAIENAVKDGVTDWKADSDPSKKLKTALSKINDLYGPVLIYRVTKGGSVDVDFQVKSMEAVDTLNIFGKLTMSFSSLFSLNGEASANYLNTNSSFMKGSSLKTTISGGSQDATNQLLNQLSSLVSPGKNYDTKFIIQAISDWSNSLTPQNSIAYSCSVAGIWELFSDDAAEVVKQYMKEKYPNKTDGKGNIICPYLYDIQAIIGD